ncbi:hypothetical protein QJS10_CPA16g01177 [Acorus calamus]|uniref:Uncharacterized protein n=1 Tax=Acorus calamus TaxID=4465 RepID=A0AAV9D147_ACOCL|nr:hypothetical protein QJS10_CPA16g01177 [Acorus calamus]
MRINARRVLLNKWRTSSNGSHFALYIEMIQERMISLLLFFNQCIHFEGDLRAEKGVLERREEFRSVYSLLSSSSSASSNEEGKVGGLLPWEIGFTVFNEETMLVSLRHSSPSVMSTATRRKANVTWSSRLSASISSIVVEDKDFHDGYLVKSNHSDVVRIEEEYLGLHA